MLPETENCTLEDIENHFSDNDRKLSNIHIRRSIDIGKIIDVEKGGIVGSGIDGNRLSVPSLKIGCDNRGYNEN